MKYQVYVRSTAFDRMDNTVQSYFVTDVPDDWKSDRKWPEAAEFPVSLRHSQEDQQKRAYEYCNYLNSIVVIHPPIGT